MNVLLDTNVILDVLLPRSPWVREASVIWQAHLDGRLVGCVTASSLTDIYYISKRFVGIDGARGVVRSCLNTLNTLDVDRAALEEAYELETVDFEDALQIVLAARHRLDAIVTRDPRGFTVSSVPVLSPTDLADRLR
jgi:predicted nucleic acid-binding protein